MHTWIARAMLALACLVTSAAWAQALSKEESDKIWADATAASTTGPASITLSNQAKLALDKGQTFVPQPQAGKVLNAMGNPGQDPALQGLVFPTDNAPWFMTIRYQDSGYVKDDDAKEWNADDLLKSYREGTEASNEERKKMGVAGIEILGWAQKPTYDSNTHRLAWAMSSRDIGAPDNAPQGVNYNTYALGREGYFSMNLVTGLAELPTYKPQAHILLDALQFNDGKRYADFNSSTDKVAEYGLAALVVGVAAKKLGFFAMIALFLAKFAKVIALAVVAFGSVALKFFKKKPAATAPVANNESLPPPAT
ncbi:DUF2167 domain-containing protein [Rhodoferax saidenbachensis]|uniref:DUF2167 domain-containing protein n=1 Tax=Rhodoferax saidenbachensis TaxID=1484693 RepID=A0A1P8KCU2_9BURK|nr:DUF2167 domain-containing protein [Rhodoferax saidenbachensis]APW43832.1 hypothetical protein RS694_15690 [Rhodoferax saidenbachensis]